MTNSVQQDTLTQDIHTQDDIILDGPLLSRTFRRQSRRWALIGIPIFGGLLLAGLCLVPRTYTAMISVALQQPSSGSSALALLAGGGGSQTKHYLGLLKSRQFAESVERHVHLYSLYGGRSGRFRTEYDAVEYLMKNVKPDDNATDGLLYVSVTLPGSPKLSLKSNPTETQVKDAAAQAANAYALALKEYYVTSDTDQGAVLLRGAETQVQQARADYDKALNNVLSFSRSLSQVDPRSAPSSPSDSGSSSPALSGLAAAYTALAQVQADLRGAQAARQTREALTSAQLRDLASLPTDDPLLSEARSRVTQDQAAYTAASRLYGPENPQVIRAQTNLEVDQAALKRQIQGVQQRLTTPNIRSDEQIQGLYARQKVLTAQIASAERRLGIHRELSGQFGRLQQEVVFQTEVLKETLTEAAKIRLDNVSAKNRMFIVDTALPPKSGEPGGLKLAVICFALTLLAFVVALVRDYLRLATVKRDSLAVTEEPSEAVTV